MDLGLFKRRRSIVWLLIVCPLMAAAGIHYTVFLYSQHTAKALQERRAMATLLPDLVDALALSESFLESFPALHATAAGARSALTTRVSELSAKHNFTANRVRINSLTTSGPVHQLEVSIEGEGSLLSIMKFVNELQAPESLSSLLSFTIRITAFSPVPVYNCELGFKVGFVPSLHAGASASAAAPKAGGAS
jgi:hypothetical protein